MNGPIVFFLSSKSVILFHFGTGEGGGGFFNKPDGPSDRATNQSGMDNKHGTVVRRPVGQFVVLEKAPTRLAGSRVT